MIDMVLNNYSELYLKPGRPCNILYTVFINEFKNHIFALLRTSKSTISWIKIHKVRVHWSVYKMNTNNLNQVCCCCWEKFGVNSKSISSVNSTLMELMQVHVYPGYNTSIEDFPKGHMLNMQQKSVPPQTGERGKKVLE